MRKKNQIGRGQHIVTIDDLKPEEELSDEELLEQALKEAIAYRNRNKNKGNQ